MKNSTLVASLLGALMFAGAASTASAQIIAQDLFDTYNTGAINGQTGLTIDNGGDIIGFGSETASPSTVTAWADNGTSTVAPGAFTNIGEAGRVSRAFDSSVSSIDTGTVYMAFNAALASTGFSSIEVGANSGNTNNGASAIGVFGDGSTFGIRSTDSAGDITSSSLGAYDASSTEFLLAIDFTNDTVTAFQDPTSASLTGGITIAFDPSFSLNDLTSAAFGSTTTLNNFVIADTAAEALGAVPEPGTWAMMLGGVALLVFVRRMRGKAV
jgi:hypothetical protein